MIKYLFFVFTIALLAYKGLGGNNLTVLLCSISLDNGKKVYMDNTIPDSLDETYQGEMVVNHLFDIYQKPPPLQKPWLPSSLKLWEKQRPYYKQAIIEMLNLPPNSKKAIWPLQMRFTKPDLEE